MSRWSRVRESFWFMPAALCTLAVVLAELLVVVDQRVDVTDLGPFAVLITRIGESGSRDVLGAIAGSVLAVAATSFSITLAVLATASSTYGPRLVRNFMADRGNQLVLGVYTATFPYSLLVLRSIRQPGDAEEVFVPHLAVNLAVLLGMLAIGVLVYFINHISNSIQVWTLAAQVRADLTQAIDRLYPEAVGREAPESPVELPEGLDAGVGVPAPRTGYVQGVREDLLLTAAEDDDVLVVLRVRPGSHIAEGATLAVLWPPERVDDALVRRMGAGVVVGQARTPHQDVELTVLVLEEMAVRALSPGTNDPYTAVNALDDLSAGLVRLAGRSVPSRTATAATGGCGSWPPRVDLVDLLDRVFDAVRWYAVEHPGVLRRALTMAQQVGEVSGDPAVHARLTTHVGLLVVAFERSSPQQHDLAGLRRDAAEVEQCLRGLTGGDETGASSAFTESG